MWLELSLVLGSKFDDLLFSRLQAHIFPQSLLSLVKSLHQYAQLSQPLKFRPFWTIYPKQETRKSVARFLRKSPLIAFIFFHQE